MTKQQIIRLEYLDKRIPQLFVEEAYAKTVKERDDIIEEIENLQDEREKLVAIQEFEMVMGET